MQRPRIQIVNRPKAGSSGLLAAAVAGLGLGLLLGLAAGELLTGVKLRPPRRRRAPGSDSLGTKIRRALRADPSLAPLRFKVLEVGRHAVELHGWVPSRLERSRALRLARQAAEPGIDIVDCLLVHGEDDLEFPTLAVDDELDIA